MNQDLWRDAIAGRFAKFGRGRASHRMAVVPEPPASGGGGGGAVAASPAAPLSAPTTKTTTIVNGRVTNKHVGLDKTQGDTMFWSTNDDQGYTIVFMNQGWPFEEPPQFIHVPPHGCSRVVTVLAGIPSGPYAYSVYTAGQVAVDGDGNPIIGPVPGRLTDPQGPPDPPTMDVGP